MPQIEHIIVLMLENRSFDFMFGFLPHPDSKFPRLKGTEFNRLGPVNNPASPETKVTANATPALPLGPDHSHAGVLHQLFGSETSSDPGGTPDCSGFLNDYEQFSQKKIKTSGHGQLIMRCLPNNRAPVLTGLASNFGVFTRWFSSVPGETWPNRNFAHAATSGGQVNIKIKTYSDKTIFELLEDHQRTWGIYHDGFPQVYAFRKLWTKGPFGRSDGVDELLSAITHDTLPNYSFVEPTHFGKQSNSQHPGNNEKDDRDFRAGDRLIHDIYEALYNSPHVFEKTLLLVTYDEHGGHYDSAPPPRSEAYKDGRTGPGQFKFDLLGVRVPCVAISPFIEVGAFDSDTVLDHSSIVRTVRENFLPGVMPIAKSRDGKTGSAMPILTRTVARTPAEMPVPATLLPKVPPVKKATALRRAAAVSRQSAVVLDEFQRSLYWLAKEIEAELLAPVAPAKGRKRAAAVSVAKRRTQGEALMTDRFLKRKTVGEVEDETDRVLELLRSRNNRQSIGEPAPLASEGPNLPPVGGRTLTKKATAKKTPTRKARPTKVSPKKASPKKASPKKASPKKASPKKASPKSAPAKKAPARKTIPRKSSPKKSPKKRR